MIIYQAKFFQLSGSLHNRIIKMNFDMHFHWIRWRLWQFQNPVRISMWNCYMQLAPVIHWNSQIKFQVVWTLKSVLDRFPSFCVVSDLDCLLSFKYKLFFLKRLCWSEFSNYTTLIQLTFTNHLLFFELFLILFKNKTNVSAQQQLK